MTEPPDNEEIAPENEAELLALIGAVRDERITPAQVERLEALLTDSARARRQYRLAMQIHGLLEQSAAVVAPTRPASESDIDRPAPRRPNRRFAILLAGSVSVVTVAVLLAVLTVWLLIPNVPGPEFVAQEDVAQEDQAETRDQAQPTTDDQAADVVVRDDAQLASEGPVVDDAAVPLDGHRAPPNPRETGLLQLRRVEEVAAPEASRQRNPLRHLLAQADIVVYGRVEHETGTEVFFSVHQTLRGDLSKLVMDDGQPLPEMLTCSADIDWPKGEFLCLFLRHDPKTGQYTPADNDAGVQPMPYLDAAHVGNLAEIIRVWDTQFVHQSAEQRRENFAQAPARKRLVYAVLQADSRQDLVRALRQLRSDD